jgi:dihydroorotate dehydrogenase electron transfer subunit
VSAPARTEPRTLAPPERRTARVTAVERLGAYSLIEALDRDGPPDPRPGQFYMLAAAERWGGGGDERPYLPRAFSHARAREGRLSFLLEAIGPGTERLAELREGEGLHLVGPLGIGWRAPEPGTRPLLVGGGIGVAPLLCLQDELGLRDELGLQGELCLHDELAGEGAEPDETDLTRHIGGQRKAREAAAAGPPPDARDVDRDMRGKRNARPEVASAAAPSVLLGFRSAAHAEAASLFAGSPALATDDGSAGRRGLVTDLLREELERDPAVTVFACGPPPMLEAVRSLCAERGVPAQLALESGMACGYGACFGCVVPTKAGYVRLCVDGPVLDADLLDSALE